MALKVIAVCLVASVALSYGAVIPLQEDALFDMIQSFLMQPEQFSSALGMTRVRRSSYDKEFNLDALGANVGIKYIDPSNQLKGGKADITIQNLKKFIPKARSSLVKLSVDFNSGDSPKDGLFEMSMDYELHHSNVEQGTLNVMRTKEGDLWKSRVSVVSKNNPAVALIPVFEVTMKSDRWTTAQGTYTCEHGNNYKIKVDRVPWKKINAVIEGNGKVYTVEGLLNKDEKNVKINIDANGLKYTVEMDMDDSGAEVLMKANVNLGGAGRYQIEVDGAKDYTSAGFKVLFNDRDFASAKLKGKVEPADQSLKYELRYSAVGAGEGKVRLAMKGGDKGEIKFQYLPKTGLDLKIEITREAHDDMSRHWHAIASRGGENYIEYKNDIIPTVSDAIYELKIDSQFDVNEKSKIYPFFCKYGCFKTRSMHAKLTVERKTPYKFEMDVELTKDGESVLTMDVNSRQNPYIFKVVAPRILPKILPTGRESIEFEADHNPGQYLRIKSNTNALSSFKIEKVANDMRRVELNGKELVSAGFAQGDKTITQTTTLPDGRSLTTTVSWETESFKDNKVTVKLDGTERKSVIVADWKITEKGDSSKSMDLKLSAKGENKMWGAYDLNRDITLAFGNGAFSIEDSGDSSVQNAPWPSPVHTELKGVVNPAKNEYSMVINKTLGGRTYGISLQNGKLSVNL